MNLVERLVRYQDLRPCYTAFIDTRSPGSDKKENFTIIGPGVAENPDQHVHIKLQHGFNIGGARQPPHCLNSQHSHLTSEVFMVHSGTWAFRSGVDAKDGEIRGWGIKRKLISKGATLFGKMLVPESTDPVSGFFVMKKSVVENVTLCPRGYKIGLEILGKGIWSNYCEIPYVFKNREKGSSKLGVREIFEYLKQVIDIFWYKMKHATNKK